MPRRSLRLQEAGYYTEQGTPSVNYKETLIRVFRRRKHFIKNWSMKPTYTEGPTNPIIHCDMSYELTRNGSINRSHQASASFVEVNVAENNTTLTRTPIDRTTTNQSTESAVKTKGSSFWKIISSVVLVLVLLQNSGHSRTDDSVHFQLQNLQEELKSLQQTCTSFPQTDTLPNLALESQGARTLQRLSSDTYRPQENKNFLLDTIFNWWCSSKKQRGVIQAPSRLNPGECWPFSGGRGHLVISLSHPVSISHVTLSHITKSQSPHGHIASAPREFSVYGMRGADEEGTLLGRMVYEQDGTPHQTFALPNPDKGIFRYVRLQIENNWGNIDYTCLYNFRVHGKTQPTASYFQGEGH